MTKMGRPPKDPGKRVVKITISLPAPLHRRLAKEAERRGKPLSQVIARKLGWKE